MTLNAGEKLPVIKSRIRKTFSLQAATCHNVARV